MEALASDTLPLPLIYINLFDLSKFSQFDKFLPPVKKNRGYIGNFLSICNFVFSSFISNLVLSISFTNRY